MVKQIKLILEYDGSRYSGWQVQPNGLSVQEVVENSLEQLLGEKVRLVSSGRTDAGVHARGMVACFKTPTDLPIKAFREGLNRFLPDDIVVKESTFVPEEFHPRYSAKGKWYRYTLHLAPVRTVLGRHYSWTMKNNLDLAAMRSAAAMVVGRHDFSAFRASNCAAKTTVREVYSLEIEQQGMTVFIDVKGGGFLKYMVRILVGTLVEIGQGKRPPSDMEKLLNSGSREASGKTAPPHGLCLMEVWYE